MKDNEQPKPKEAEITIKFSVPDESGQISTDVVAKAMTIGHFKHLASVANWYIENEFPQEEQDELSKKTSDTIEEK